MTKKIFLPTTKRPYMAPDIAEIPIRPTEMLASSTPEVHTSDSKVSNDYEALVKGDIGFIY